MNSQAIKLSIINRFIEQLETRQGGSGDYTKEKQERSQEREDELRAEFEAWIAARRVEEAAKTA